MSKKRYSRLAPASYARTYGRMDQQARDADARASNHAIGAADGVTRQTDDVLILRVRRCR